MRKRIRRISLNQTAWTLSVMMFLIGIVYAVVMIIIGLSQGANARVWWFLISPVVSLVATYIGYVIAYWFYNIAAAWTGGIEFDLVDKDK